MSSETILVTHLRPALHSVFPCMFVYEKLLDPDSHPSTRPNNTSTLGIGFMHMLTIVHMLYLSSKSLFVRTCIETRTSGWVREGVIAY